MPLVTRVLECLRCLLARAPATLAAGGPLHFLRAAADLSFFAPPPRPRPTACNALLLGLRLCDALCRCVLN